VTTAPASGPGPAPLFSEVQHARGPWWTLAMVFVATVISGVFGVALWVQLVLDRPFGNNPASDGALIAMAAVGIPFGVALAGLIWSIRMEVAVREDGVYLRYLPFVREPHRYGFEEIAAVQAQRVNPVLDYGGWGIRLGLRRRGMAYLVVGREGVLLDLTGGRRRFLGSQRAGELAAVIAQRITP
jgi:hypothetical protein